MQITKTNPPRCNCILLREKLFVQQSAHRPHFDHQVLRLRPLENLLCSRQPATLVLTHMETGNIPLKNSLWIKRFFIKLPEHYGYQLGRFQLTFRQIASCTTIFSWWCASSCGVTLSWKTPLSAETIVSQNICEVVFVVISKIDPVAIVLTKWSWLC